MYDRATQAVKDSDKFEMYVRYIRKVEDNFGITKTRPIYEKAIEDLPDDQVKDMCLRFAAMERKLGEIDRARAILAHAAQFCDPRTVITFWKVRRESFAAALSAVTLIMAYVSLLRVA